MARIIGIDHCFRLLHRPACVCFPRVCGANAPSSTSSFPRRHTSLQPLTLTNADGRIQKKAAEANMRMATSRLGSDQHELIPPPPH